MKKIIYLICLLLIPSLVYAGGIITREVSNPNPDFGETITITLRAEISDTDSTQNEWVNIEENVPSWTYNAGDLALSLGKLVTAEGDLPAGTKTYSYTVTAPSSASTLTFSGRYQVGEGQIEGNAQTIGGISSISVGGGSSTPNEPSTPSSTITSAIGGSSILVIALIGVGIYLFMKSKK